MDLKWLPNNSWLYRAVLVVWIVNAIIVMLLLNKIDTILNVTAYKYGLQFSYNWANPYWAYMRLNYLSLSISIVLSLFTIAAGFAPALKKMAQKTAELPTTSRQTRSKSTIKRVAENVPELKAEYQREVSSAKITKAREETAEPKVGSQPAASTRQERRESPVSNVLREAPKPNVTGIHCSNCGKTISRPMLVLDSTSGKTRLMSVCPYCDHVLGEAENEESSRVELHLADVDQELIKH